MCLLTETSSPIDQLWSSILLAEGGQKTVRVPYISLLGSMVGPPSPWIRPCLYEPLIWSKKIRLKSISSAKPHRVCLGCTPKCTVQKCILISGRSLECSDNCKEDDPQGQTLKLCDRILWPAAGPSATIVWLITALSVVNHFQCGIIGYHGRDKVPSTRKGQCMGTTREQMAGFCRLFILLSHGELY